MTSERADIVEAFSSSANHGTKKGVSWQRAFSILLFSVFIIVDLLAIVVGASSYGSLVEMQNKNDARIMTLGPIISSVRANDGQKSVATAKGPEGDALVLVSRDAEGTYETRIYLYEGNTVHEYALAESPYAPQKATVLASSSVFEFSYDDDILNVTTGSGTARIALRSEQGGA